MTRQNFAATALYFERRAGKASSIHLRKQLEAAAAYYRSMAQACGHHSEPDNPIPVRVPNVPPRRRRLIELFQACNNAASQLSLDRIARQEERERQSMVDEGRASFDAASSVSSS